jgi:two-component system chemotaxis sensor kinase CheA
MSAPRPLIYEFVGEAKEHLANVSDDLLALEQSKDDTSRYRIDRLFRAVHSVKGGAGFFGCQRIEELAHLMETVFEHMRQGGAAVEAGVIDALLAGADRILALLDDVEHSNDADVSALLGRLRRFVPATLPVPAPAAAPFVHRLRIDLVECHRRGHAPAAVVRRLEELGTIVDAHIDVPGGDLDAPLPEGPVWLDAAVSSALPPERFRAGLGLPGADFGATPTAAVVVTHPAAPAPVPARATEPPTSVRIPVALVDRFMGLAGELVLVRNQAVRALPVGDPALAAVAQRLNAVTSELQDAAMRMRMQSVGNLFGKFPRVVRDLARQLGKHIELVVSGTEVELDKTILEALSDPLTHLIRNACDHGIETAAQRRQAGKPEDGRIGLSARHLGGRIAIEVRDDGRGISPDSVRRKALEQGLRTSAELARLGDREVLALILLPGLSTAQAVTDLSGRGVGMDVVKTNLERLGGTLDIDSSPGRGTTFTLYLPLTLAVIPCLLVGAGGERYAISQKDVEELVWLQPHRANGRIEKAYDQEVIRLRGRLLPLIRLADVLRPHAKRAGSVGDGPPSPTTPAGETMHIAVARVGAQRLGLVIDDNVDTEEIVVQPLHPALAPLTVYSGATVLGDGRATLILSAEGIARRAGVSWDVPTGPGSAGAGPRAESETVLLFRSGPREQFAVPLAMIRRIESVRADRIERVGDREFVTVEGMLTPVLRLDRVLSVSPCPAADTLLLLLPRHVRRPLGVLMSEIIDTEAVPLDLSDAAYRADGLVGSGLVRGQMTLFLDVYRLADLVNPPEPTPAVPALPARARRVLLVEDTQFFRHLVKGYLEGEGYAVVTAVNGAKGLERLGESSFDLVVSDIEMPVMDGWAFARALRELPGHDGLPLLALTTLNSPADRERAMACGFDGYEVKVDRERFLAAVRTLLKTGAGA